MIARRVPSTPAADEYRHLRPFGPSIGEDMLCERNNARNTPVPADTTSGCDGHLLAGRSEPLRQHYDTSMSSFARLKDILQHGSHLWLVTGAAGFIGSNLVEALLRLDQRVVGLDNFATGHQRNLDDVLAQTSGGENFRFVEGDIRDLDTCHAASKGVDYVLHQAALGSVPRSIKDPLASHQANVDGFINILIAARDAQVRRLVYASSSSVYGDEPRLPKVEHRVGNPLSPYAATKAIDEVYADVFARTYGMELIGLRYFNVFGRRQDPEGAYAAVIPRWVGELLDGKTCVINGDGETSRDFCYIDNVIQANLLAATTDDPGSANQVYNVAVGERTTLNELFALIRNGLGEFEPRVAAATPRHEDFRAGDVRHSLANIDKARELLGYAPDFTVQAGLERCLEWYAATLRETPLHH